tara:strand:+ start:1959 stop:2381 length:423 start_codon:yes stop_codon:yes gene_type:complete
MTEELGAVMAFDYGLRNIGIAIGQNITKSSSTFYAIKAKDGEPDWTTLDSIIEEWQPDLFIVGDPFNMDGTKSEFQKRISKFSSELKKRYKIRLHMMDERLTTKEAKERIKDEFNGLKGSANKHSISAQIILEDWFRSEG